MTGIDTVRAHGTAYLCLAALTVCAVLLVFGSSDGSDADPVAFGDGLWWTFGDGQLQIGGFGSMNDWSSPSEVPWDAHRGSITSITMANGVTTIGNYAFQQCQITECSIPDTVTWMGTDCFKDCDKMTHLTIGAAVTNLSADMLSGCSKMNDITLNGTNYALGQYQKVLYSADKKDVIYFPQNLQPDYLTIEDGAEKIRSYALQDCKALVITIPDSVKVLEDRAFYNSTSHQTTLKIGADMTYVGSKLFGDNRVDAISFHLDFKGTLKSDFTSFKFENADGSECTDIPGDLLGKQFSGTGDDPYTEDYAALSIRYVYATGETAQPRVYELMGEGLEYSYATPAIDGYKPNIDEVSGTSDLKVRDVTVVYSNRQYDVVYYYNGDEVMRYTEYFGYTVQVQPYEKGHVSVNDWSTVDVDVVDGEFVMPDMDVYFSNIPVGIEDSQGQKKDLESPETFAWASCICVIVIAAAMIAVFRKH